MSLYLSIKPLRVPFKANRRLANRAVIFLALPLLGVSLQLYAEGEADSARSQPSEKQLSPLIEAKAAAHQACVTAIMSTYQSAATKRTQIAEDCAVQRAELVNAFPEEYRALLATNVDRRIESVLYSLEQIEGVVVESATDVQEMVDEIDALREEAATEP